MADGSTNGRPPARTHRIHGAHNGHMKDTKKHKSKALSAYLHYGLSQAKAPAFVGVAGAI